MYMILVDTNNSGNSSFHSSRYINSNLGNCLWHTQEHIRLAKVWSSSIPPLHAKRIAYKSVIPEQPRLNRRASKINPVEIVDAGTMGFTLA
jgi:hypothetical protein